MTIAVMIVDDQAATRLGLTLMVEKAPDCTVMAQAHHGLDALETLRQLAADAKPLPDVVLMDIRMPVMNGIDATAAITREFAQIKVLALTTYDQDDHAFAMLGAGAAGFLLKDVRTPQLHDALRAIAQGDAILTPRITRELLNRSITVTSTPAQRAATARLKDLSPRERAVAQLVATGLNNQEIAARLHVQPDSVKKTVTRILAKLGLRDRVQITIAVRNDPPTGS